MKCYVRMQDTQRGVQSGKYVRKAESIRLKLFALNDSYINSQILVTQFLIFRYASLKERTVLKLSMLIVCAQP